LNKERRKKISEKKRQQYHQNSKERNGNENVEKSPLERLGAATKFYHPSTKRPTTKEPHSSSQQQLLSFASILYTLP